MYQAAAGSDADPRAWQRRWLEAVTASMDAYLAGSCHLDRRPFNRAAPIHIEPARAWLEGQ
jgi:hypothetical protein